MVKDECRVKCPDCGYVFDLNAVGTDETTADGHEVFECPACEYASPAFDYIFIGR